MTIFDNIRAKLFNPTQEVKESIGSSVLFDTLSTDRPYKVARGSSGYSFAFASNPYLFRAISYIAESCAGIEWLCFSDETKEKELDENPALLLLNHPNPDTRRSLFISQMVSYRLLTGNSYMATSGPKNGLPKELWNLRPDRITIKSSNGYVSGYEYIVNSQRQTFEPESVMHWKTFNPYDDYYGLSPVAVASTIVDSMSAGEEWNLALKLNSGRPSGAIISSTPLSPNAYETLKREITRNYTNAKNAGKPLLLQGGLDWKQFSLSPMDVDWLNDKKQSAREIALVLGVPPELLGDSANKTYSNYGEARQSYMEETVLPIMDSLREELNAFIGAKFGCYLEYDKDDIEALREDRDKLNGRIIQLWNCGLIFFNEARTAIGYEEHTEDFANTKNVILSPIEEMGKTPVAPVQPTADVTPTNQDLSPITDGVNDSTANVGSDGVIDTSVDSTASWLPGLNFKALDLKKENHGIYWKSIEDRREYWYGKAQNTVNAYFKDELKSVLAALPKGDKAIKKALDSKLPELTKTVGSIYYTVGKDFGKGIYNSIKMQAPLETKDDSGDDTYDGDLWAQYVQDYLSTQAATKIVQISDITMQRISNRLAEGVARGESIVELAERIKGLYDEFYVGRSKTIARTEVIGASNGGAMVGATQTGLDLDKEWISTSDKRTREAHKSADSQTVSKDEPFSVDGEDLDYPGDSTKGASAENIVNCRCTVAFLRASKSKSMQQRSKNLDSVVERMKRNIERI